MDGLSGRSQSCIVALSILVTVSYCAAAAAGTCKDGICEGFTGQVDIGGIKANLRHVSPFDLEAIAKVLSDQRKFGPEITAQDILDVIGEALSQKHETL